MLNIRRSFQFLRCFPNVNIKFCKYSQWKKEENRQLVNPITEQLLERMDNLAPDFAKHVDSNRELVSSFTLAAYANRSSTVQKLIDLGVDVSKLEKRKGIPEFLIKLDFERDMKGHIQFLHDTGVPAEHIGKFLTKNPLIFKEELDLLRSRIEFMLTKQYTPQMISHIVSSNPYWLMFSVDRIEKRLNFFKTHFSLLSEKMCQKLVCQGPRLITYNLWHVKVTSFSVTQEMGFNNTEMRIMALRTPKIWMINNQDLVKRFDFVHNEMKVPHGLICRQSEALLCRHSRLKQRHLFLVSKGRDQYNPKLPNYISLTSLVSGTDAEFAIDVAYSSMSCYSEFLKTL